MSMNYSSSTKWRNRAKQNRMKAEISLPECRATWLALAAQYDQMACAEEARRPWHSWFIAQESKKLAAQMYLAHQEELYRQHLGSIIRQHRRPARDVSKVAGWRATQIAAATWKRSVAVVAKDLIEHAAIYDS